MYSKKLLKYYVEKDEDVSVLCEDFEINVKLSVINCFVPVMKTSLETSIGVEAVDSEGKRFVTVEDFDKEILKIFFDFLAEEQWPYYQWDIVVRLIKFSHFYQATDVLTACYKYGQNEITANNFHQAVQLMDLYDFDDWVDEVCAVVSSNPTLLDEAAWQDLLTESSTKMAVILDKYIRIQHEKSSNTKKRQTGPFNFGFNEDLGQEIIYEDMVIENDLGFNKKLFDYFLKEDEQLTIIGDSFRLQTPITVIQCFAPEMLDNQCDPVEEMACCSTPSPILNNKSNPVGEELLSSYQVKMLKHLTCPSTEPKISCIEPADGEFTDAKYSQRVVRKRETHSSSETVLPCSDLAMVAHISDFYEDFIEVKGNQRKIRIKGFDKKVVKLFLKMLTMESWVVPINWNDLCKVLEMAHTYCAKEFLLRCYKYGERKINKRNMQEAIELMARLGFNAWDDRICMLLDQDKAIFDNEEWKGLLKDYPKVLVFILDRYIRTKLSPAEMEKEPLTFGFKKAIPKFFDESE